jgi:hypothetical protein
LNLTFVPGGVKKVKLSFTDDMIVRDMMVFTINSDDQTRRKICGAVDISLDGHSRAV